MSHVYNHEPIRATWTCVTWAQGFESKPNQGTNFNMQIDVLKSSILENHLITSEWCKLLTTVRETTSNANGSQGTTSIIHEVWRMI